MSRKNILTAVATVFGAALFAASASVAFAHETEVHHWFEHQRAQSDGGEMPVLATTYAQSGALPSNGGRTSGVRPAERRVDPTAPDCLIERLQMTDGYVPSGKCPGGFADERWLGDEKKARGRAEEASGRR